MNDFNKILEIANDKTVKLSNEFKELLGTELHLGMSNYVCKKGTLSDGFEKILPSQRYYQSIKEMWSYGNNIRETEATAMQAQAQLQLYTFLNRLFGWIPILSLFIKSKLMMATQRLTNLLVTIEDQVRILKAFNDVRIELQPEVRSKYKSIEEAEPDHWDAVLKYRIARQKLGKQEFLNHVPGTPEEKALMGLAYGAPEAAIWLAIEKEKEIDENFGGDMAKYLESKGYLKLIHDENIVSIKKKD